MSTLADLVRERTWLGDPDVRWLHRLVGEWQLVSDLSFADLIVWVPTTDSGWLAAAHIRPTTGPTAHPKDLVDSVSTYRQEPHVARAYETGEIVRGGGPLRRAGRPDVRQEAVPIRHQDRVVAVLSRETDPRPTRRPGTLELAYLASAEELLQMVAEGTFPYPGGSTIRDDPEHAPRVGDGLLRLDTTGHVVYASPNAQSAYRRLGMTADLLGVHLGRVIGQLADAPQQRRAADFLVAALQRHQPGDVELEAAGATALLRAMPLVPGGHSHGVLLLVRDVTELRRRDRQLLVKEATIREIHHRVKNNLQTVAALLRLQARRLESPEARAALEESVRRVSSIALVHETLALTMRTSLDFDGVADQVVAMYVDSTSPEQVDIHRVGSFGDLPATVATPLAMVLTELVQNALAHGFPALDGHPGINISGRDRGNVWISVRRESGHLEVDVVDDGVGIAADFDPVGSAGLGLQIVGTLVTAELGGTLEMRPRPAGGTCVHLVVPVGEG